MAELDKQAIRQKVMGVLLRHARLTSGRSQSELAAALRITKYRYAQYEQGQRDISLAELEVIANLCGLPVGYFFDDSATVADEGTVGSSPPAARVRRKLLGTLLRQARTGARKTQKDCAEGVGIPARRLAEYESGNRDVPLTELDALAAYLQVGPNYFSA